MAKNLSKMGGAKKARDWDAAPTLEIGMYPARMVQYIDIGMQPRKPYKGKEKSPIYMARVAYELVDAFMYDEDGNEDFEKPRWVFETLPLYSLESDRAKSTQRHNAIDPDNTTDGVLQHCITFPCQVQITHGKNEKDPDHPYENIGAIAPPPRRGEVAPLVNDPVVFDMDEPDVEVFESLAPFIQEQIKNALDFEESPLAKLLGEKGSKQKKVVKKKDEPVADNDEEEDDDGEDCPF